jgi:bacterial/archaeal transporter family-2 protein
MYILLAAAAGAGLALQAVINVRLRVALESALWAAITQVIVGFLMLTLIAVVLRQPPPFSPGLMGLPWWAWTGGLLGGAYVIASIMATGPLGAAVMIAAVIVGQTTMALAIDHFGWLGVEVQRVTLTRAAGAALMFLGLALIRWR